MNIAADNPPISEPGRKKLFTFWSGGWVLLLALFFTLVAAALVLYPVFMAGGFIRAIGDGKHVDTYGFDLSHLLIPADSLIASGVPKDQIRAIPQNLVETITPAEVDLIAQNEHIRFLVPGDEVIGLVINGEARAYPLRILVLHELVNDTLGGTPIAVTYAPLTDSALVFDRRIEGDKPLEFGISGLLVDSNTVYFDRHSQAQDESLWPQLALHAVSGPKAGQPLKLLPYELTTWKEWRTAHPDTRVLEGLRTLKTEYGAEPYGRYRASNELKFPVAPLWKDEKIGPKTRVVLTPAGAGRWKATLPTPASMPPEKKIYASIFAWYAQHPGDTDYASLRNQSPH